MPATDFPLPSISWRVNGSTTLPEHWEAVTDGATSELFIRTATREDAGYIECLVKDGKPKNGGIFALVTSSRRARLKVVSKYSLHGI